MNTKNDVIDVDPSKSTKLANDNIKPDVDILSSN